MVWAKLIPPNVPCGAQEIAQDKSLEESLVKKVYIGVLMQKESKVPH